MAWEAPKLDWIPQDYWNAEDFNRQKNNILHAIEEFLSELGYFTVAVKTPDKSEADFLRYSEVNALERNLEAIEVCGVMLPADWSGSKIWNRDNDSPDFMDYIRWERNVEGLLEVLQNLTASYRYSGEIYAGEDDYND